MVCSSLLGKGEVSAPACCAVAWKRDWVRPGCIRDRRSSERASSTFSTSSSSSCSYSYSLLVRRLLLRLRRVRERGDLYCPTFRVLDPLLGACISVCLSSEHLPATPTRLSLYSYDLYVLHTRLDFIFYPYSSIHQRHLIVTNRKIANFQVTKKVFLLGTNEIASSSFYTPFRNSAGKSARNLAKKRAPFRPFLSFPTFFSYLLTDGEFLLD